MTDTAENSPNAIPDNATSTTEQTNLTTPTELLPEPPPLSKRTSFLMGIAAGGFLALVFLGFSMDMSHIALSEVSPVEWGTVLVITGVFGWLGAKFGQQFFDVLESILPVPF